MFPYVVSFLTGDFPYSTEFQSFWMAFQGSMIVRNGPNKEGKMEWFHAFAQGVLLSFAGACFGNLWMARQTSMFSQDLNIASCIITYLFVNCLPMHIGHKIGNLFPLRLITVIGAQLFRTMGIVKFVNIAYETFKDNPSDYYPTPVFGPILNATLLGNMGAFFWKGFHGHLKSGMPLPFQNGIFCASIYHFVANDDGPIGEFMRSLVPIEVIGDLSHKTCAILFISLFMQAYAILQLPEFAGPSFNPFNIINFQKFWKRSNTKSIEALGNATNQKKKKKKTKNGTKPKRL